VLGPSSWQRRGQQDPSYFEDLVVARDGTVGGTTYKGGVDVSLARMVSCIGCM
jgi:hypothetical protein